MPDLGHALPVRFVGGFPVRQRVHIEVLPVTAQAEFVDFGRYEIGEELAGGRVAQVKEEAVAANVDQPVAVGFIPGSVFVDAFGFEPEHQFAPGPAQRVAERFETVGVKVWLDLPVADVDRPTSLAKPLGIDPIILDRQVVLDDLLNVVQVHRGAGPAPIPAGNGRQQRLARALGPMMRQKELAQQILALPTVALVKKKQHSGGANCFSRVEDEVRVFEAGFQGNLPSGATGKLSRPFAAPANGGHDPAVPAFDIEKREHLA